MQFEKFLETAHRLERAAQFGALQAAEAAGGARCST